MTMRLLDLFSGIGGFSLGLEQSGGFRTVAFCEIEEFPRRVLAKHWREVPCYDDVRTLTARRLAADGIAVDAICGGFPCQDVSVAGDVWGLGAGLDGKRSGLWSEFFRLIRELRPTVAIVENVTALLGRGLSRVLRDLASIRYDAEWRCVPASGAGAPHERDRIWIVAYPRGARLARPVLSGDAFPISDAQEVAQFGQRTVRVGGWWTEYPAPRCVGDGLSTDVVRSAIRGCGNAVVPAIPELIGRAILASMRRHA